MPFSINKSVIATSLIFATFVTFILLFQNCGSSKPDEKKESTVTLNTNFAVAPVGIDTNTTSNSDAQPENPKCDSCNASIGIARANVSLSIHDACPGTPSLLGPIIPQQIRITAAASSGIIIPQQTWTRVSENDAPPTIFELQLPKGINTMITATVTTVPDSNNTVMVYTGSQILALSLDVNNIVLSLSCIR